MSKTVEFTLTNTGDGPVSVEDISLSAGTAFTLGAIDPLPLELPIGSSMMFDITASSTVAGTAISDLTILHSGENSPYTARLSANFLGGELTPPEVEGLVAWYDVSQLVGFNNGDLISTLPDLSGSGYPIEQTTLGSRSPVYTTNAQNGLPTARFNRSSQCFLSNANQILTQEYIGVWKVRIPTFPAAYGAVAGETRSMFVGNTGTSDWVPWSDTPVVGAEYFVDGTQESANLANAFPLNFHLYDVAYFTSVFDKLVVGMGWFTITQCLDMDLCEMAIYDNSMSPSDREKLSNYFINKWGLS